jgi:hypothetical protein
MKRFDELTPEQQEKAVAVELASLLEAILEGSVRFNDALNSDDLQSRIDTACERAAKMQTPWFAHEYILDTCREDLEAMARPQAEDAVYLESDEHAVRLAEVL